MFARLDSDNGRTLLLLAALMALALALHLWQTAARRAGHSAPVEAAVCAAARPLQVALDGSLRFAERQWAMVVEARRLYHENARLRTRVAALEERLSLGSEERAAAERARRLLAAPTPATPRCIARVIGLGQDGWSDVVTLDVGASRGVRPRDVVLSAEGLVGQVIATAENTARVLSISDPASSVAVRVQRSREPGILKGLGAWRCEVRYLDPQADVQPGDAVITSGLGGIFPAALRVGTVTRVGRDRDTAGKVAEVRPWASIGKTEEVLVMPAR